MVDERYGQMLDLLRRIAEAYDDWSRLTTLYKASEISVSTKKERSTKEMPDQRHEIKCSSCGRTFGVYYYAYFEPLEEALLVPTPIRWQCEDCEVKNG